MTAGTLKVGGDFVQLGNGSSNVYSSDNFYAFSASGSHTVVLDGTAAQAVSFEKPSDSYSHFQNLVIANTSVEGVGFTTRAYVLGDLEHQSGY